MQTAKRFPECVPAHRTAGAETAVWLMIVILVGIASLAMVNLFERVGG